jgi:hypothetical protein
MDSTSATGRIDLDGIAPFANGQVLKVTLPCTIVAGSSGSGKTTLAAAFMSAYCPDGLVPPELHWLIKLDGECSDLPCGGMPWVPLAKSLARFASTRERLIEVSLAVESELQKLLSEKIAAGRSKFAGNLDSSSQIRVLLTEHGTSLISSDMGEDLSMLFQAQGERLVLYLALNVAIRRLLNLSCPFVNDSALEMLDLDLLSPCFACSSRLGEPVLLLIGTSTLSRMAIRPSYWLSVDPATKETKLVPGG